MKLFKAADHAVPAVTALVAVQSPGGGLLLALHPIIPKQNNYTDVSLLKIQTEFVHCSFSRSKIHYVGVLIKLKKSTISSQAHL